MIDIEAMRKKGRTKAERKPVKTFLTEEATERLRCAAEYTGMHMYELIEELIMTQVPKIEQLESDDGSI